MSERQRSQGLKFGLKSASVVPRCCSHQCTLTPWVSDELILTSSMLSSLTSYEQLLPYPAHFGTRVDPDIFDGIARFHRNKRNFVDYDKEFLEKSLGAHFCQFRFSRVRPIILQLWKKPSSISCPEGKDLKVLNLPSNLHRQSPDVATTSVP